MHEVTVVHPIPHEKRGWGLESVLLALLGAGLIWQNHVAHAGGVIGETIILVVFLTGLLALTKPAFPSRIPFWSYPLVAGVASMFMDSFLVLIILAQASLMGAKSSQYKFKTYNTHAALIGGTGTYFGEVYLLPLALMYGVRQWWGMLPLLPPILVFLGILCYLNSRVNLRIERDDKGEETPTKNYFVFAGFIVLLFATKNPAICLGLLFLTAFLLGRGKQLIELLQTEIETAVMLLLILALLIAEPVRPLLENLTGALVAIPAVVNAVLTGAVYPAQGNFWAETLVLTTSALAFPISSLVGIILFRSWEDWKGYLRNSVILMLLWLALAGGWLFGPWKWWVEEPFYQVFGERPSLVQEHEAPH